MVQIYSEPLCRRYYASRLSWAYFVFVVVGVVSVVMPFFLAYSNTPGFWLKTSTYREQPDVEYTHKSFVVLQGLSTASGAATIFQIFSSTMSSMNALHARDLRVPVQRATRLDENRDGLADRFRLELTMPLDGAAESIMSCHVVHFFNVKLKHRARLEFEAVAYAEKTAALAGAALYVDGDLELRQRWPLKPKGGYWSPYEDEPLLDPNVPAFDLADVPRLLAAATARNYTMDLDARYAVWTPAASPAATFNLTLDLRIPTADVLYTPTATEVLKAAWIRYLSLAVLVYYLLDKLCQFIFYFQLVDTTMTVETPTSKDGKQPSSN